MTKLLLSSLIGLFLSTQAIGQANPGSSVYPFVDVATTSPPLFCDGTDQGAKFNTLMAAYPVGAHFIFHNCRYTFVTAPVIPTTLNTGVTPNVLEQPTFVFEGSGAVAWGQNAAYNGSPLLFLIYRARALWGCFRAMEMGFWS